MIDAGAEEARDRTIDYFIVEDEEVIDDASSTVSSFHWSEDLRECDCGAQTLSERSLVAPQVILHTISRRYPQHRQVLLTRQHGEMRLGEPVRLYKEPFLRTLFIPDPPSKSPGKPEIYVHRSHSGKPLLLLLPPEIRIMIYRYLLITPEIPLLIIYPDLDGMYLIRTDGDDERQICWRTDCMYQSTKLHVDILATCRQTRQEGMCVLFQQNTFGLAYSWAIFRDNGCCEVCPDFDDSLPSSVGLPYTNGSWKLNATKLLWIRKLYLSQDQKKWFDEALGLRVLQDFPNLCELHLELEPLHTETPERADRRITLVRILRAVHLRSPPLRKLACSFSFLRALDPDAPSEVVWTQIGPQEAHRQDLLAWLRDSDMFPGCVIDWSLALSGVYQYGAMMHSLSIVVNGPGTVRREPRLTHPQYFYDACFHKHRYTL